MFGAFYDIAEQHGARHGPDATWYRRQPARHFPYAWIKITNQSGIGTGNANIDTNRTRSDHVRSDQTWPTGRGHHDGSLLSVPGDIDGSGVAQRDRRVLAFAGQQQSERAANRRTAADYANLCSVEFDATAAEQLHDSARRTRQRARLT
jgi:hypothetical protein